MNTKELESFKLSDAIKFNSTLNSKLWTNNRLLPQVRTALMQIARDFVDYLGITDLDVEDVTVSGSNAAYTYTSHSDLDLHIVVDFSKLDPDEVYQELFSSKKNLYNAGHKITVHGIDIECYVQDSGQEAVTLGEYSVLHDRWIRVPAKRRPDISHTDVRLKYEKLRNLVELALVSERSSLISAVLKKLRTYRQAGLDRGGEFSSENLAYKAIRSGGAIDKLYKLRDTVRGRELSIENMYALEEASGYVPSQSQRNDPRWASALSADVNPYSIQNNARRLGSKIARDGRPPILRTGKK